MPFPNFHACRLESPDKFKRFTQGERKSKTTGKMFRLIYGWFKSGGKEVSKVQAMRYAKSSWSESEARSHCQKKGGRFEAAKKVEEMSIKELADKESNDFIPIKDKT